MKKVVVDEICKNYKQNWKKCEKILEICKNGHHVISQIPKKQPPTKSIWFHQQYFWVLAIITIITICINYLKFESDFDGFTKIPFSRKKNMRKIRQNMLKIGLKIFDKIIEFSYWMNSQNFFAFYDFKTRKQKQTKSNCNTYEDLEICFLNCKSKSNKRRKKRTKTWN